MKKLLLTTAAILCFAMPATAQEYGRKAPAAQQNNAYFTVRMGGSRLNMKIDQANGHKSLFMMSGAFGTKIAPDVRAEIELMATNNYEKTQTNAVSRYEYKHGVGNLSLNILKDFDAGQIKPYVGVGIGAGSFTDEFDYQVLAIRGKKKETNTVLSGNVQAGVSVALTNTVSLDANARYTYFGNYEIKILGTEFKMKNNSTDLSVGLRFAF